MFFALLALHVLSLMFWVGSLVSITRVLTAAQGQSDPVRAQLAATARKLYRVVASPWMGIATVTGIAMIISVHGEYFAHGWFHAKLAAAAAMLALHFALGARVRSAELHGLTDEAIGKARPLQLGVLVVATLAVFSIIVWKGLYPNG